MASTGPMNSSIMTLTIGGTVIAHGRGNTFSNSREMIDITTQQSSANQTVLPGLKTKSFSFEGLVAEDAGYGYNDLLTAQEAGTALTARQTTSVSGDTYAECSVYVSSLERTGGQPEDVVQFSCELTGSGALTTGTEV